MTGKFTRRELAVSLAASMSALQAQRAPAEEHLAQATGEARKDAEALRSYPLTETTGPAFVFKP